MPFSISGLSGIVGLWAILEGQPQAGGRKVGLYPARWKGDWRSAAGPTTGTQSYISADYGPSDAGIYETICSGGAPSAGGLRRPREVIARAWRAKKRARVVPGPHPDFRKILWKRAFTLRGCWEDYFPSDTAAREALGRLKGIAEEGAATAPAGSPPLRFLERRCPAPSSPFLHTLRPGPSPRLGCRWRRSQGEVWGAPSWGGQRKELEWGIGQARRTATLRPGKIGGGSCAGRRLPLITPTGGRLPGKGRDVAVRAGALKATRALRKSETVWKPDRVYARGSAWIVGRYAGSRVGDLRAFLSIVVSSKSLGSLDEARTRLRPSRLPHAVVSPRSSGRPFGKSNLWKIIQRSPPATSATGSNGPFTTVNRINCPAARPHPGLPYADDCGGQPRLSLRHLSEKATLSPLFPYQKGR